MKSQKTTFESALHEELGMNDAQLRAELVTQGLNPTDEANALRSMIASLGRTRYAPSPIYVQNTEAQHKRFAMFDEAVAAGHPSPSSFGEPAQNMNLLDLLHVSNPEFVIWARVSGWSMRDEGIRDGDLILVDTRQEARDGDIVLAHLAGEGQVVKRLRLENGFAYLDSANPEFSPILVADSALMTIHGVVIGRAGLLK